MTQIILQCLIIAFLLVIVVLSTVRALIAWTEGDYGLLAFWVAATAIVVIGAYFIIGGPTPLPAR